MPRSSWQVTTAGTKYDWWTSYANQQVYTTAANSHWITIDNVLTYAQPRSWQWQTWLTSGTGDILSASGDLLYAFDVPSAARRRGSNHAARKQRRRAERRGAKLLLHLLDEGQQREYARAGTITVLAADGRVFRLRKGKTAELLDLQGRATASYCIHLEHGYVPEDTLIAQLMMLRTEPAEFERIANVTRLRPAAVRQPTQAEVNQAERWLRERDREAEAMLRAEGIANPREWDEALRAQVRERYRRGDEFRPAEPADQRLRWAVAHAIIADEMHEIDAATDDAATRVAA